MFHNGGIAYVYLCYGMHHLFNIVTHVEGIPHAVLVRAIRPTDGLDIILARRKKKKIDKSLTAGPATVTQALGIKIVHNGIPLTKPPIWIEDRGIPVMPDQVKAGKRIGIDYAGKDALLPWRFQLKNDITFA
jgi:DNA-3-methyladenine glycosylase